MHNSQNKKTLQIVLVVLIAVLSLGIGYATISNINLTIDGNATANPNDNNFKVHFVETVDTPNLEGNVTLTGSADIDKNDNTMATFNVGGLTKEGDYAIATYTIINNSNDVGAKLSLELTNSNTDYFKVTETITDTELQAGDTTTGTVKVEMIKTPLTNEVTTSITAKITATAVENASTTGGDSESKQLPTAFASDTWTTIKTNVQNGNTSQYNIGDTKSVTINGNNYRVRIANKTTGEHCGDNDTEYSQTACGFVVEFADIVEQRAMNTENTNVGGWPATEMRTYLNGTFFNSLPSDLQAVIKTTRVISGYGSNDSTNFTTTDKLYLLSVEEVFGIDGGGNNFYDTAYGTSHQLEYYSNNGVTYSTNSSSETNRDKAIKQYDSSNSDWWMRSAASTNDDYFRGVNGSGRLGSGDAANTVGVAPAFRIG